MGGKDRGKRFRIENESELVSSDQINWRPVRVPGFDMKGASTKCFVPAVINLHEKSLKTTQFKIIENFDLLFKKTMEKLKQNISV